jgi:hypothetical protein
MKKQEPRAIYDRELRVTLQSTIDAHYHGFIFSTEELDNANYTMGNLKSIAETAIDNALLNKYGYNHLGALQKITLHIYESDEVPLKHIMATIAAANDLGAESMRVTFDTRTEREEATLWGYWDRPKTFC